MNIYALLYIKQITNRHLLYSMKNYNQYFVITFKGKNLKRMYIYVYLYTYIGVYIHTYIYTHTHIIYVQLNHGAIHL